MNNYYAVRLKRANLARLEQLAAASENFKFFEGDICDKDFTTRVFETEQPRWMPHLAARAGVRPSIEDPFVYIHSNIDATTRLLELTRVRGCEHFVFASSSSIYGGSQKSLFSEADDVSNPVSSCWLGLSPRAARQPARWRACVCLDLAPDYFFRKTFVFGTCLI